MFVFQRQFTEFLRLRVQRTTHTEERYSVNTQ